ncbi:uncharacterized protein LOC108651839 [Drosophila navojoa]|uniref:uncharacterized protein LOC108651839 n=1 Tax=Drosophila navojoa TaxID=7232 RepID=UPI000846C68F|nr:uncharacterized protein LOC108651839 [Drosophila navojoa]
MLGHDLVLTEINIKYNLVLVYTQICAINPCLIHIIRLRQAGRRRLGLNNARHLHTHTLKHFEYDIYEVLNVVDSLARTCCKAIQWIPLIWSQLSATEAFKCLPLSAAVAAGQVLKQYFSTANFHSTASRLSAIVNAPPFIVLVLSGTLRRPFHY